MLFIIMNARAENFNFNIFLWVKGYSIYKGTNIDGYNKILLIKKLFKAPYFLYEALDKSRK